jgi:hypothetical protein
MYCYLVQFSADNIKEDDLVSQFAERDLSVQKCFFEANGVALIFSDALPETVALTLTDNPIDKLLMVMPVGESFAGWVVPEVWDYIWKTERQASPGSGRYVLLTDKASLKRCSTYFGSNLNNGSVAASSLFKAENFPDKYTKPFPIGVEDMSPEDAREYFERYEPEGTIGLRPLFNRAAYVESNMSCYSIEKLVGYISAPESVHFVIEVSDNARFFSPEV